jgi:GT2 family glycosyltransferase
MSTVVVVPVWNGLGWLPACLQGLAAQDRAFDGIVVVDNGSSDGSAAWLAEHHPDVHVIALATNTGFAAAANRGFEACESEFVALVNTDVVLASDWHRRLHDAIATDPVVASVACKMVRLDDETVLDDAGDQLRRDAVCEQRGHARPDDGRWDEPGDVFSACAGAALFRRGAVADVGGLDERLFAYLEDVDLGLRLRLAGWRCRYEPAVARHARGGSSDQLTRPPAGWVARNTLLLVAKAWPVRWLPLVAYRQAAWLVHAARGGTLRTHLAGLAAAVPLLPAMLRERRTLRAGSVVPIAEAIPSRPWRGPRAGGHPRSPA